jgi:uncharacterized membrane protein YraQ (UPF0718 family)
MNNPFLKFWSIVIAVIAVMIATGWYVRYTGQKDWSIIGVLIIGALCGLLFRIKR